MVSLKTYKNPLKNNTKFVTTHIFSVKNKIKKKQVPKHKALPHESAI